MTRARPANDHRDLRSRPVGTRLLLPELVVSGYRNFQSFTSGMEITSHVYTFHTVEGGWRIEYLGQHHHSWKEGRKLWLVATIKAHEERWGCTKISRPLEQSSGDVPLFG